MLEDADDLSFQAALLPAGGNVAQLHRISGERALQKLAGNENFLVVALLHRKAECFMEPGDYRSVQPQFFCREVSVLMAENFSRFFQPLECDGKAFLFFCRKPGFCQQFPSGKAVFSGTRCGGSDFFLNTVAHGFSFLHVEKVAGFCRCVTVIAGESLNQSAYGGRRIFLI